MVGGNEGLEGLSKKEKGLMDMDNSVRTDCGRGMGWAEEGKGGKLGQL